MSRAHEPAHTIWNAERFRLLVDSVRDYAIFMLDPDGRIATWNLGAERIKGYTREEIVGRHFSCFYDAADVASGKCERELEIAALEGRFADEGWRVRKDGSRFWASVVITALRDDGGALVGFAKVTRDLTEQKKAEQERIRLALSEEANRIQQASLAENARLIASEQRARSAADAANRSKDMFLATVSHELRTPLSAILGWSRMLIRHPMEEVRKQRALASIERSAVAMAKLIDDLLDFSRIVSGKMRIEPRPIDLAEVIVGALESIGPAADAKGIRVVSSIERGERRYVGDPTRLQQIVWNLASNAVKFTPQGGTLHVTLRPAGEAMEIVVSDTGMGIDADFLPVIFDAFLQAEGGISRTTGGLGLGLAITKHLVELHGGTIAASSEGIGKGATFVVSLPYADLPVETPRQTPVPPPTASSAELPPRLDGVRVLLVEDHQETRELLHEALEQFGAEVTAVPSASEAMTQMTHAPVPDVLLSDIAMPGESGYDLIRWVRALPPDRGGRVAAAAVTAFTRPEDRQKAFDAGYTMHVPKPVDPAELARVIKTLAAKR